MFMILMEQCFLWESLDALGLISLYLGNSEMLLPVRLAATILSVRNTSIKKANWKAPLWGRKKLSFTFKVLLAGLTIN